MRWVQLAERKIGLETARFLDRMKKAIYAYLVYFHVKCLEEPLVKQLRRTKFAWSPAR